MKPAESLRSERLDGLEPSELDEVLPPLQWQQEHAGFARKPSLSEYDEWQQ